MEEKKLVLVEVFATEAEALAALAVVLEWDADAEGLVVPNTSRKHASMPWAVAEVLR